MTTAATRTVVLLGHPVAHSRSPQIHTAAFAAAGIDAVYVTADVPPARLPEAVAAVRALGWLGANVTVPHKQAAAGLVDALTPEAELVGAVNTIFWSDDRGGARLMGDNTDASGLVRVLEEDVRLRPGDTVEIFGAGGVARAAAVAAGRVGARVRVSARRPEAAASVAALAASAGAQVRPPVDEDVGVQPGTVRPRVVVNATPLGMHGEALPDDYMRLEPDQVALDLVYADEPTPFVRAARSRSARAFDGLGLLVAQAAGAFERWTGRAAPYEEMARAARG